MKIKFEEMIALSALSVAGLYLDMKHPKETRLILDAIKDKTGSNHIINSGFIGDG